MKKRYITAVCCLLAAALTSLCAISQARQQRLAEKLIRLHVVANSDTREDQRVKLLVRDAVLETANGLLRDAQNPEAALQTASGRRAVTTGGAWSFRRCAFRQRRRISPRRAARRG